MTCPYCSMLSRVETAERERDALKINLDFAEEDVAIAKRRITELEAEVARLKAENARLRIAWRITSVG